MRYCAGKEFFFINNKREAEASLFQCSSSNEECAKSIRD